MLLCLEPAALGTLWNESQRPAPPAAANDPVPHAARHRLLAAEQHILETTCWHITQPGYAHDANRHPIAIHPQAGHDLMS